ncbi:MAG: beta-ketoacyl synthase N-terminal-like domain-containing protein [Planctomycetota bacterium]|nr:beta-ketoacyl synthase N-terminal-like domain-containing protein [Planctomycetota bacterium]
MTRTSMRPLNVTGYSMVSALGVGRDQHLAALSEGRTGLQQPSIALPFETAAGEVPVTLPELPESMAVRSTRISRMAALLLEGLDEPLRRARERWRPERIAVLLGTSVAGAEATENAYRTYIEEGQFPKTYDFQRQHTFGAVLHVVAELVGAKGPAWMASTACTSSGKPFATARRLMAADLIDAAVVGGLDTLCELTLTGFQSLQALDVKPCRPFNVDRGGISIGEGGVLALVEREGDPRVLVGGVGETSDCYHISAPHPEGSGARQAMADAMAQAGCKPEDIDHVNAHGTGTRLTDIAEAKAIGSLLPAEVPVVSTKGYTGHTLGAAAALEFAFAACAIEEGWIPRSLGSEPKDPEIGLTVPTESTRGSFRRVISNSFAFGGNNVSLLVEAP